jgi:hypothetical protein
MWPGGVRRFLFGKPVAAEKGGVESGVRGPRREHREGPESRPSYSKGCDARASAIDRHCHPRLVLSVDEARKGFCLKTTDTTSRDEFVVEDLGECILEAERLKRPPMRDTVLMASRRASTPRNRARWPANHACTHSNTYERLPRMMICVSSPNVLPHNNDVCRRALETSRASRITIAARSSTTSQRHALCRRPDPSLQKRGPERRPFFNRAPFDLGARPSAVRRRGPCSDAHPNER